jgi:hypothetical protein
MQGYAVVNQDIDKSRLLKQDFLTIIEALPSPCMRSSDGLPLLVPLGQTSFCNAFVDAGTDSHA